MVLSRHSQSPSPFHTLRTFARNPPAAERCELCGATLPSVHTHLLEPDRRQLICACDPCALLFSNQQSARYRRVPQRRERLSDFRLTDAQWESFYIPINLAFFVRSTPTERVTAFYPSPAGAMESLLTLDAWQALVGENPILNDFEPDVEALLVNRVGSKREVYRVPIDDCFKLVGLVRTQWRGLSGGSEVWQAIDAFFEDLRERYARE